MPRNEGSPFVLIRIVSKEEKLENVTCDFLGYGAKTNAPMTRIVKTIPKLVPMTINFFDGGFIAIV